MVKNMIKNDRKSEQKTYRISGKNKFYKNSINYSIKI